MLAVGVRDASYVMRDVPSHDEATEAGLWIKNRVGACSLSYSCVVMSRSAWASLHARQEHLPVPYANNSDVLAYARYHGANAIVIEKRALASWPIFDDLWNLDRTGNVTLVYETTNVPPARVFVFEREKDWVDVMSDEVNAWLMSNSS